MDDLLAEFVAETREMLEASEGELIAWEADPSDHSRLGAIFRFVHTVKGNSGFFDVPQLEKLGHAAEDALAEVRAGKRKADPSLVTAILGIIDRIMELVDMMEAGQKLPEAGDEALIAALAVSNSVSPSDKVEVAMASPEPNPASNKPEASVTPRSIRLPVDLLDRVMSGVSDMVLARNDLAHRLQQAGTQPTIDGPFERLSAILTDVRDAITRMRMQRVELLFGAFPRLVRDLSTELGKQVAVDLEGGDVELDREMIEMIRDPMTHLVRNAVDHGIEPAADRAKAGKPEQGILGIAARQSGNKISIVVSDDGRGLDEEKIAKKAIANGLITKAEREEMTREEILQLIFAPGLSTAEQVSAISGRGVGLDVVRENIEKIGGSIKVTSTPGVGTLFYLQIPLTLSIIAGLTVEVGGQRFAMPQSYVEEIVRLGGDALSYVKIGDTSLVTFRGQRVPCLSLANVLGIKHVTDEGQRTMVMLRLASGDLFALAVDQIHNSTDLVVKPLPREVMATELYGGSTLLDNGVPILLLDIPQIAMNAGLVSDTRTSIVRRDRTSEKDHEREGARAILFTDCMGKRRAVRMELIQRIETISADAVHRDGKRIMAVIGEEILPLVGTDGIKDDSGNLRLLRLSDGNAELAYAVRDVQDAITLDSQLVEVKDDPLIEAKILVQGEPVALIDGHAIFAQFGQMPKRKHRLSCHLPNGEWAQSILAPLLESAGYNIRSDSDGMADIVITLDDVEGMESNPGDLNIIRLRSLPDQDVSEIEKAESIYRYDRQALFAALSKITRGEAA